LKTSNIIAALAPSILFVPISGEEPRTPIDSIPRLFLCEKIPLDSQHFAKTAERNGNSSIFVHMKYCLRTGTGRKYCERGRRKAFWGYINMPSCPRRGISEEHWLLASPGCEVVRNGILKLRHMDFLTISIDSRPWSKLRRFGEGPFHQRQDDLLFLKRK
jgi:hypothetical protein